MKRKPCIYVHSQTEIHAYTLTSEPHSENNKIYMEYKIAHVLVVVWCWYKNDLKKVHTSCVCVCMCGSHLFLFIISSVSTFSYLIFFSVYLPSIHTPTPHPPLAEEYTFYHRFSFIIIFIPFYHPVCRTRTAATNLEEWQFFEDRHNSLVKCHVCPEYTFNYVLLSNSSIRKRKEDNIIISNISRNTHFLLFLFSFLPLSLSLSK